MEFDEDLMLQHYRVLTGDNGKLCVLGKGSMGITYKAVDTRLHREVALKLIKQELLEHEEARKRFLREARAAASLRHPNVAIVFDFFEGEETSFIAMEFIRGRTLAQMVEQEGPLPAERLLTYAVPIASALEAAEKKNLIHRDIKPANIMMELGEDGRLTPKLIDFGLAKALTPESEDAQYQTLGGFTPIFASPEQLEEKHLDIRTDIYSLGVTLWYCLIGEPPFRATSIAGIIRAHLSHEVPMERLAEHPESVGRILIRMLEKDRAKRQPNAAALREELEQCLEEIKWDQIYLTRRKESETTSESSATGAPAPAQAEEQDPYQTRYEPSGSASGFPARQGPKRRQEETSDRGRRRVQGDQESSAAEEPAIPLEREAGFKLVDSGREEYWGWVYRAKIPGTQGEADLLRVLPESVHRAGDRERLAALAGRARNLAHPHVLRVSGLVEGKDVAGHEFDARDLFVVLEAFEGVSYREIAGARKGLELAETIRLLEGVASAVDYCAEAGFDDIDLEPEGVKLCIPQLWLDLTIHQLVEQRIHDWPEVISKVLPLAVEGFARGSDKPRSRMLRVPQSGGPVYGLGLLAYYLLGGEPNRVGPKRFRRIKHVDMQVNEVLRACLNSNQFASGGEFVEALEGKSLLWKTAPLGDEKGVGERAGPPDPALVEERAADGESPGPAPLIRVPPAAEPGTGFGIASSPGPAPAREESDVVPASGVPVSDSANPLSAGGQTAGAAAEAGLWNFDEARAEDSWSGPRQSLESSVAPRPRRRRRVVMVASAVAVAAVAALAVMLAIPSSDTEADPTPTPPKLPPAPPPAQNLAAETLDRARALWTGGERSGFPAAWAAYREHDPELRALGDGDRAMLGEVIASLASGAVGSSVEELPAWKPVIESASISSVPGAKEFLLDFPSGLLRERILAAHADGNRERALRAFEDLLGEDGGKERIQRDDELVKAAAAMLPGAGPILEAAAEAGNRDATSAMIDFRWPDQPDEAKKWFRRYAGLDTITGDRELMEACLTAANEGGAKKDLAVDFLEAFCRDLDARSLSEDEVTLRRLTKIESQLERAQKLGVKFALPLLAKHAKDIDLDLAKALEIYVEISDWYPPALYRAGMLRAKGIGGRADGFNDAVEYFRTGAEQGDPLAMYALAECYLDPQGQKGVPTDVDKGIDLLNQAVEKSEGKNVPPEVFQKLGECYDEKSAIAGTLKDPEQAEANYRRAFEEWKGFVEEASQFEGETLLSPRLKRAYAELGRMYLLGMGVESDLAKALESLAKGVAEGDSESMYLYAVVHLDDNEVMQKKREEIGLPRKFEASDPKLTEAVQLMKNAAKAGHAGAKAICDRQGWTD